MLRRFFIFNKLIFVKTVKSLWKNEIKYVILGLRQEENCLIFNMQTD